MKKANKQGFTLVEVVIAAVIFAITTAGLYAVFSVTRTSSSRSERKLQAAYLGKQLLEELHAKVDERDWSTWYLTCPTVAPQAWPEAIAGNPLVNNFNGAVEYECTEDGVTGVRKVTLYVTWDEP